MKKILTLSLLLITVCSFGQTQETVVKKKGVNILIVDEDTPPTDPGCNCPAEVFKIRNVNTVNTGIPATVTLTKINGEWLFDFGIPKGEKGDPGISPTVSIGTVTTLPFTSPATVTDSDPSANLTLNFGIPQGVPGSNTGGGTGGGTAIKEFTPLMYGAKGDGVTDDTNGFQQALQNAISQGGEFVVPEPANYWRITNTIQGISSTNQVWRNAKAYGRAGNIRYMGPGGRPVFRLIDIKAGRWEGFRVSVENGQTDVQIFDWVTGSGGSTSFVTVANFYLNLGSGANVVGQRFGFIKGVGDDISIFNFENCNTYGYRPGTIVPGQIAYLSQGSNTLAMNVYGGITAYCDKIFSNKRTNDQDVDWHRGGGCWYFFGVNSSQCRTLFEFDREGTYGVYGGRFESDEKVQNTSSGSQHVAVTYSDCRFNDYKGTGPAFEMSTAGSLKITNCQVQRQGVQSGFPDLVAVNNIGGLVTVIVDGGASRAVNIVRRTGGPANSGKYYIRGHQRFSYPNAVNVESFIPDVNGQLF